MHTFADQIQIIACLHDVLPASFYWWQGALKAAADPFAGFDHTAANAAQVEASLVEQTLDAEFGPNVETGSRNT
eukprot:SAG31_NODE_4018_length_3662_cov_2.628964_2_plen_74_part_00